MTNRTGIALAACLLAGLAQRLPAQNNKAEVFGGYTYAKINPEVPLPKQNASGWVGSE